MRGLDGCRSTSRRQDIRMISRSNRLHQGNEYPVIVDQVASGHCAKVQRRMEVVVPSGMADEVVYG